MWCSFRQIGQNHRREDVFVILKALREVTREARLQLADKSLSNLHSLFWLIPRGGGT